MEIRGKEYPVSLNNFHHKLCKLMSILGGGYSFLGRFKALAPLVEYIFRNFPSVKEADSKFHIIPCGVARIVLINTAPPETFEDLAPQDVVLSQIIEERKLKVNLAAAMRVVRVVTINLKCLAIDHAKYPIFMILLGKHSQFF